MKQRVGLFLLIAVAVIVGVLAMRSHQPTSTSTSSTTPGSSAVAVTVTGYVGGEKMGFIADPDVVRILHDKYGLAINGTQLGSLDMVRGATTGQDFLWPSSQVALDLYKTSGKASRQADVVFNSPIVLYSWDKVTKALTGAGVVRKIDDAYYIVDMPKFIGMISAGNSPKP